MEARPRLAVPRVSGGWKRRDAAAVLGVHPEAVGEWVRAHEAGGDAALAARPHPGRKPFLTPAQQTRVLGWLADKPTAHRFRTDLWTARRVAALIRNRFGVEYHPHYLREWLTKRGHGPQEPARRPRQRDRAAIDRWLQTDRPRITKNARRREAHVVLIDETGLLLIPLVCRSWAVRENAPVIGGDGGHWKKVSVSGCGWNGDRFTPRTGTRSRPPGPGSSTGSWRTTSRGGQGDLDDEIVHRLIELTFDSHLLRGLWEASERPFPNQRQSRPGELPASQ